MAEAPTRAGPTLLTAANTSQTIVTAGGAGAFTIVRDITVVNETTGFVVVTIGVGTSNADAAGKRILKTKQLAPNSDPWTWGGFLPLLGSATTPDLLYALCDTANGATITAGLVTGP